LRSRINSALSEWTRTFTDPPLCAAMVDRRTFDASTIETGTASFRLRATRRRRVLTGQLTPALPLATTRGSSCSATSTTSPLPPPLRSFTAPPGPKSAPPGSAAPTVGDLQRLSNLAPCIPAGQRYSRIYRGRRELIDHIFASHVLVTPLPRVCTVHTENLLSITDTPTAHAAKSGSDHGPVVATFDLG
jgi:hypothetical protein